MIQVWARGSTFRVEANRCVSAGLIEVVRKNAGLEAEGIRKAVFGAVTEYRGDDPQEDDITLVVLKFS